jgi:hypothetical protein
MGAVVGAHDNTPHHDTTPLTVQVLLDTGAVIDNYCSKAVGDWVRRRFPQSWETDDTSEPVNLAAIGASTVNLGSISIDITIKKSDGDTAHVFKTLQCTVIDLPIDIIIGRPAIRRSRIVHALPDYFCEPAPPSANQQAPNALPVLPQTRDAADPLPASILQPAKPAGGQSRNKGESLTFAPRALLPPGTPTLGGVSDQKKSEPGAPAIGAAERSEPSESSGLVPQPDFVLLSYIPTEAHTAGKPFLGSVDVRMKKHVSELLDITKESYGMLGEDSELFPDASTPLTVDDILAAVQIEGPLSLQSAVRGLVTEFADIFSNDVGQNPALVDPMRLTVDTGKWADSKTASTAIPIGGGRNPPSGKRPISPRGYRIFLEYRI